MSSAKNCRLIRMLKRDLSFIYEVRNHESVRSYLIDDKFILWKDHYKWYHDKYKHNPDYIIWIIRVLIDDKWVSIGFCDVKHSSDDIELGWKILPEFQNQGYGIGAVKILTNKIKLENEGKRIFLTVLVDNNKAIDIYKKYNYIIDNKVPIQKITRQNGDILDLYTLEYQDL